MDILQGSLTGTLQDFRLRQPGASLSSNAHRKEI
jgi:hypothetical protein